MTQKYTYHNINKHNFYAQSPWCTRRHDTYSLMAGGPQETISSPFHDVANRFLCWNEEQIQYFNVRWKWSRINKDETIKNVKFQKYGNPTCRVYNSYKICRILLPFCDGRRYCFFQNSYNLHNLYLCNCSASFAAQLSEKVRKLHIEFQCFVQFSAHRPANQHAIKTQILQNTLLYQVFFRTS